MLKKSLVAALRTIRSFAPICACAAVATAAQFQSPSPEIVSAWKLDGENAVVVFRYDGSYYLVDANTGSEGLERGTFTWNKSTGAFSVDTIVDTNGDGGLSHPSGATTIAVSGNTLSYTVAGEGTFTFSRVVNTSSAIVGSWIIPGARISVTFLADNTYYLSEEANDPPFAITGIEKGTYSWNSTTKQLTSNPAIDTNGLAGIDGTWNVNGNTLAFDDGNDITEMFRITTNSSPFALPDFFAVRYANFEQASDSAPVPETFDSNNDLAPYSADAFVLSQVGASAPTLKIGSASPFAIDPDSEDPGGFEKEFLFQNLTALNTFMPASSALQFMDGAGTANLTGPLGTFPSTPKITLRGGATWDAGVYAFGDDELLQWTLPSGFSASQFLTRLEIYDPLLDQDVVVAELQGDVTHFDLTGLLEPGTDYEVSLEFYRIDNSTTSGTGVFTGKRGYALAASSTTFQVRSLPEAGAVEFLVVKKLLRSVQQSADALAFSEYTFDARVEGIGISPTFPASSITLSKPDNSSLPLTFDFDWWNLGEPAFPSLSALQSTYPDGTYKINIGSDSVPISLGGVYPNIPKVSSSVGTWTNGKLQITASQAAAGFTLTSNSSTGDGFVSLAIYDPSDEEILETSAHLTPSDPDFVSANVTPGLLSVGQSYTVEVEFDEVVDYSDLSGYSWAGALPAETSAFGLLSTDTTLTIEVVPDGNSTVEIVSVGKFVEYIQTGSSTVILDPAPVTQEYGGPYGFQAGVQGQNLSSIAAPTVTPPAGTPNTQNDPFYGTLFFNQDDMEWRYGPMANDWGALSQAAIDNRFPNGIYTFSVKGVSIPLNLTGNAYPNTPQLTLSGGNWINGKYAMDSSNPLTVTTNVFAGYGSNVDGHIYLGINDLKVEYFRSSHPANNFATLTAPANTLPTNQVTRVGADFDSIVDKSSALSGSLSVASYGKSLDMEVHILPKIASQSSNKVLGAGASVTLQVTATGSPATASGQLNYQWKKNGVELPGKTSDSLSLSNFALGDAASYTCTVSNDVGSATSLPINVEFADAFQTYVSGFSLNSVTDGAPDGDSDNDGLDTLIEFILGGSPNSPNSDLLKNATTTPAQTGRNLVFFYDRKTIANGISQVIETSPSLNGTWTPAVHGQNGVVISITTLDANTQRVTATVPTTETRLFVRLKASR